MTVLFSMMPVLGQASRDGIMDAKVGNLNFRVIMLKSHAALGILAKMPALERLLLPSGCLDLRSTAALRQQEALSGRAFLPESLDRPCDFVPMQSPKMGKNQG